MFYKTKRILIKYIALYVHKDNKPVKQKWCIIVIIKDSILINNRLPNRFWAKLIETVINLQNKLFTTSKTHNEMILEKV